MTEIEAGILVIGGILFGLVAGVLAVHEFLENSELGLDI